MFDGAGSPLTQTFGLGLFEPFLEPEFEQIEEFFSSRGSPTNHEVCSLAAEATRGLLEPRGYVRTEQSTVLIRSTAADASDAVTGIQVRRISAAENDHWARISSLGWASEAEGFREFIEQLSRVTAQVDGVHCFIAESDDGPMATGTLHLQRDVALLAGASTIPSARRQGAQLALLQARLAFAASLGIQLAMVVTQPEGASLRNAERRGFRPVYSRTKWERRA